MKQSNSCLIQEQEIKDSVSGLTLRFKCDEEGKSVVHVLGPFPYGNSNFYFNKKGKLEGQGTFSVSPNETKIDLDLKPSRFS
jgi:hypothetical protein